MKRSTLLKFLKIIIGFTILIFIIYKIGSLKILDTLLSVKLEFISLILLLIILSNIFGAIAVLILLKTIDYKINITKIIVFYFISWSIGLTGLGKIGELSIIYLLRRKNKPIGKISAVILFDKLITLFSLCLISIVGLYVLFGIISSLVLVIVTIILLIIIVTIISSNYARRMIKRHFLRKYATKFHGFYRTLKYLLKHKKKQISINIILTFIKWFLTCSIIYLTLSAFSVEVNLIKIFLIHPITILAGLIPISLNGLGVKESVALILYSCIGVTPVVIASTYLLLRFLNLLFAGLIGLFTLFNLKIFKKFNNKMNIGHKNEVLR